MKLRELFDAHNFKGNISLHLVEDGVEYQTYDSYETISVKDCDGSIPGSFLPYADSEIVDYQTYNDFCPDIRVYATPSEDTCEVFYTGGGIWCGICKVSDGWFMGETNSWGCVWKTYSQAQEAFPDEECGFIRYVQTVDELKKIWTHIYETQIEKDAFPASKCRRWLETLDKELGEEIAAL